jgi:YVTN family beta-propeller protein
MNCKLNPQEKVLEGTRRSTGSQTRSTGRDKPIERVRVHRHLTFEKAEHPYPLRANVAVLLIVVSVLPYMGAGLSIGIGTHDPASSGTPRDHGSGGTGAAVGRIRSLDLPGSPAAAHSSPGSTDRADPHPQPQQSGNGTPISVGHVPLSAVYDSGNGYVYVVNAGSNSVSVIQGTALVTTIPVGGSPQSAAYDSANGSLYVVNQESGTVSILTGTNVTGTVSVGTQPIYATYDTGNGLVYVLNSGSGSVSVIRGDHVLETIVVGGDPETAVYDSGNDDLYVSNVDSDNVSVINGNRLAGTVAVGAAPSGPMYDARNGYVYVPNEDSNNVSVINGTTLLGSLAAGSGPRTAAYDPGNGYVYIVNYGSSNVSVFNGTTSVASVLVGTSPIGVAYDAENGYIYVADQEYDTLSVIAGTVDILSLTHVLSPYAVTYDGGNGYVYVVEDEIGTVTAYAPFPSTTSSTYAVTFAESGLPSGTSWVTTLGGVVATGGTPAITFSEPNGTYAFGIGKVPGFSISPSFGTVSLNGSYAIRVITLTPISPERFNVTFTASGLPAPQVGSGPNWWVVLDGSSESSNSTTLVFTVPNGTYGYSAGAYAEYDAIPSTGILTVNGSNVTQPIQFVVIELYTVTFTETGLPSGTNWGIILNDSQGNSTNSPSTVAFNEPNGSYSFEVQPGFGYSSNPGYGNFTVDGASITLLIAFTSTPSSTAPFGGCSSPWCGWDTPLGYAILIVGAASVIEGIAVAILYSRRTGPPPVPADRGLYELEGGPPPAP